MSTIPVVDLGPLNLPSDLVNFDAIKDVTPDDPKVNGLAAEVVKAFTDIGFLYLINHPISETSIDKFNEKTGEFFKLPTDVKEKYRPTTNEDPTGWQGPHEDLLDEKQKPDFKEVYNIAPKYMKVWPEEETPGFKAAVMDMYVSSSRLAHVVLKMMAVGLGLEDPDYFIKMNQILTRPNLTTIRACYYPPVPKEIAMTEGVLRCGQHSDWGSITLLYQDEVGGLEVMNRDGKYVPATPVKGGVLVNVADMMQRWTSDKLVSTKHRVMMPKENFEDQHTRRSIALFVIPDDEAVIRCIDNSDKYPPVSPHDYIVDKLTKARHGTKTY